MSSEDSGKTRSSMTVANVEKDGSLGQAVAQLGENLAALRDFVELIEPVLNERREAVMTDRAHDLAPLLSALHEADPESFPEPPTDETLARTYGSEIHVSVTKEDDDSGRIGLNVSGNTRPFRQAVQELMRSSQHVTLLYRNALVSLVSYVEWFVSRLLHEHYAAYPGSWEGDRCLSLRELESIGTVDEARRFIIDQKVEEQLRASFEEWIKHFKSHLGLGMGYLDPNMNALVELFQRRNLTVHHGGIVNSTYLSRVDESLTTALRPGMPLPIDRTYVMSSIDLCDLCFTLIGAEAWKKRAPSDSNRARLLVDLNYEHMMRERWSVSEGLSLFLCRDGALPERDRLIGQVNYWQSLKWQQRDGFLAECLADADFDAKEPIFRFCLLALRDDLDTLIQCIPAAVDRGDLEISYLEEWPIFRGLRQHNGYPDVLAALTELPSGQTGASTT